MATTLSGSINLSVKATLADNTLDVGKSSYSFNESFIQAFTNGTAANQANQVWADNRAIGSEANDDIDLAGVLLNALGTTLTFTSIKAIAIKAAAANANNILLGPGEATGINAFETIFGTVGSVIIPPGGMFLLTNFAANGFGVTASTADILRLTNASTGTVNYEIILIGETA